MVATLNYNQDLIMKKLLVLFMFIMVTHAHAFTLNDLIGTYKVTLKEAPVVSTITVEANGMVEIVETSPVDELVCMGFARIKMVTSLAALLAIMER